MLRPERRSACAAGPRRYEFVTLAWHQTVPSGHGQKGVDSLNHAESLRRCLAPDMARVDMARGHGRCGRFGWWPSHRARSDHYCRLVIGIALLTLVPGELGGSESATRGLLQALGRTGTLAYRIYLPPAAPDAAEGLPHEVVREYRAARTTPARLLAVGLATARPGPLRQRLAPADVVHFPFTIRVPSVSAPTAVTLHDLQHLDLPSLFSRADRAWRSLFWHRSARAAQRVIVPSAFVRDRATALLGIADERLRVIPHGLDHARFSPDADPHQEREPFLLYPARSWPHKNHDRLFQAFAQLRRERPELRLVLTGGGHSADAPDGVDVRGNVSLDELVSLYRRASALVFPSLYEGFGQPVLEAMACGCPVACSDIPALVEVAGDAACTFRPTDPAAIADTTRDLMADPAPYSARGLERAAAFTWDKAAEQYESVYRELL
jgi:glycosyltransferase involved in cell wall biosynthesis